MLSKILYRRPRLEAALSALDNTRLKLPVADPVTLFDDFNEQPITLTALPAGPWASPLADVVTLAKIARCIRPRRVLEVGSYRGYTARLLAEHTPTDSRVVAFDRDPRHGEFYRGTPLESRIERRVGAISAEAFASDRGKSFDLIFLDADHTYESVCHDTEILLPLLAPTGVFVWHDYANWGRFSRKNGVPEALHGLARRIPIAAVSGSWLAVHSPAWATGSGATRLEAACHALPADVMHSDPWTTAELRG